MKKKLTDTQVRHIRLKRASGAAVRELARDYGVSATLISRICHYQIYTHTTWNEQK